LVLVLGLLDLEADGLGLRPTSVTLPLQGRILPQEVFNDQVELLKLNPVIINLRPEFKSGPLVGLKLATE
jgi:hypothetical protein